MLSTRYWLPSRWSSFSLLTSSPSSPSPVCPPASSAFYKIFGYPTGLGALLVRTEAAADLRKGEGGEGRVRGGAGTKGKW